MFLVLFVLLCSTAPSSSSPSGGHLPRAAKNHTEAVDDRLGGDYAAGDAERLLLGLACSKPAPSSSSPSGGHLPRAVKNHTHRILHREGFLLEAVDDRLGGDYAAGDAERLLLLGLACSNPAPSSSSPSGGHLPRAAQNHTQLHREGFAVDDRLGADYAAVDAERLGLACSNPAPALIRSSTVQQGYIHVWLILLILWIFPRKICVIFIIFSLIPKVQAHPNGDSQIVDMCVFTCAVVIFSWIFYCKMRRPPDEPRDERIEMPIFDPVQQKFEMKMALPYDWDITINLSKRVAAPNQAAGAAVAPVAEPAAPAGAAVAPVAEPAAGAAVVAEPAAGAAVAPVAEPAAGAAVAPVAEPAAGAAAAGAAGAVAPVAEPVVPMTAAFARDHEAAAGP